jgi:hypothetical protein
MTIAECRDSRPMAAAVTTALPPRGASLQGAADPDPRCAAPVQGVGSGCHPDEERARLAQDRAIELQHHLQRLQADRALASIDGLTSVSASIAELDSDIAAVRDACVGAAVTEIASLRAELSGRLMG